MLTLTRYERRLVEDFALRRKLPAPAALGVGLVGLALMVFVDVPSWIVVVTSALCGGLVGAWVEKRHLHDLSGAVSKLIGTEE